MTQLTDTELTTHWREVFTTAMNRLMISNNDLNFNLSLTQRNVMASEYLKHSTQVIKTTVAPLKV